MTTDAECLIHDQYEKYRGPSFITLFSTQGNVTTRVAKFHSLEMLEFFDTMIFASYKLYSIAERLPLGRDQVLNLKQDCLHPAFPMATDEKQEFSEFFEIVETLPFESLFACRGEPNEGYDFLGSFLEEILKGKDG